LGRPAAVRATDPNDVALWTDNSGNGGLTSITTTLANIGFLIDGKPAPAYGGGLKEQGQEGGHQVYGTFFTLPRGHSADLVIYYEVGLPADPPFNLHIQEAGGHP